MCVVKCTAVMVYIYIYTPYLFLFFFCQPGIYVGLIGTWNEVLFSVLFFFLFQLSPPKYDILERA